MALGAAVDAELLIQQLPTLEDEAELRRCVRDLVALSSLPALWIKADARQIADAVAQVVVSVVGADFSYVKSEEPRVEALHFQQPASRVDLSPRHLRLGRSAPAETSVDASAARRVSRLLCAAAAGGHFTADRVQPAGRFPERYRASAYPRCR